MAAQMAASGPQPLVRYYAPTPEYGTAYGMVYSQT
jgi:hypothetical protein